jgi:hypothetical protein
MTVDLIKLMQFDEWDLNQDERDAIKAIIAERDGLKADIYDTKRERDDLMAANVLISQQNERLMKALKLCIPLLRDDVIEEETGQCYYCGGRDEDNGDAHKDDCRQVIAYLTAREALEPKP